MQFQLARVRGRERLHVHGEAVKGG